MGPGPTTALRWSPRGSAWSTQYNRNPNDLVYKTLLLSRTVTRLGEKTTISMADIGRLHALDLRALEYAVYRLTYGEENLPPEEPGPGG